MGHLNMEPEMLDDETKEIVRTLNQPHRVLNIMSLFRTCERAATVIQNQAAEIERLTSKPAAKVKKASSAGSSDT